MSALPATLKLTYEDLLTFPEDGRRHEILDGDHVVTPSPTPKHQLVVVQLAILIGQHVQKNNLGRVFPAPLDVVLSDVDVVEPDLLYLSNERLHRITETHVRGAPSLVVEVVSESSRRRDEVTKRRLYARYGVEEYWVVDPVLETLKVYRPGDGDFRRAAELSREAGDVVETPLLPGLVIALEEVFL